jgi:hypothetical protein
VKTLAAAKEGQSFLEIDYPTYFLTDLVSLNLKTADVLGGFFCLGAGAFKS